MYGDTLRLRLVCWVLIFCVGWTGKLQALAPLSQVDTLCHQLMSWGFIPDWNGTQLKWDTLDGRMVDARVTRFESLIQNMLDQKDDKQRRLFWVNWSRSLKDLDNIGQLLILMGNLFVQFDREIGYSDRKKRFVTMEDADHGVVDVVHNINLAIARFHKEGQNEVRKRMITVLLKRGIEDRTRRAWRVGEFEFFITKVWNTELARTVEPELGERDERDKMERLIVMYQSSFRDDMLDTSSYPQRISPRSYDGVRVRYYKPEGETFNADICGKVAEDLAALGKSVKGLIWWIPADISKATKTKICQKIYELVRERDTPVFVGELPGQYWHESLTAFRLFATPWVDYFEDDPSKGQRWWDRGLLHGEYGKKRGQGVEEISPIKKNVKEMVDGAICEEFGGLVEDELSPKVPYQYSEEPSPALLPPYESMMNWDEGEEQIKRDIRMWGEDLWKRVFRLLVKLETAYSPLSHNVSREQVENAFGKFFMPFSDNEGEFSPQLTKEQVEDLSQFLEQVFDRYLNKELSVIVKEYLRDKRDLYIKKSDEAVVKTRKESEDWAEDSLVTKKRTGKEIIIDVVRCMEKKSRFGMEMSERSFLFPLSWTALRRNLGLTADDLRKVGIPLTNWETLLYREMWKRAQDGNRDVQNSIEDIFGVPFVLGEAAPDLAKPDDKELVYVMVFPELPWVCLNTRSTLGVGIIFIDIEYLKFLYKIAETDQDGARNLFMMKVYNERYELSHKRGEDVVEQECRAMISAAKKLELSLEELKIMVDYDLQWLNKKDNEGFEGNTEVYKTVLRNMEGIHEMTSDLKKKVDQYWEDLQVLRLKVEEYKTRLEEEKEKRQEGESEKTRVESFDVKTFFKKGSWLAKETVNEVLTDTQKNGDDAYRVLLMELEKYVPNCEEKKKIVRYLRLKQALVDIQEGLVRQRIRRVDSFSVDRDVRIGVGFDNAGSPERFVKTGSGVWQRWSASRRLKKDEENSDEELVPLPSPPLFLGFNLFDSNDLGEKKHIDRQRESQEILRAS